jgi:hypothetical protein
VYLTYSVFRSAVVQRICNTGVRPLHTLNKLPCTRTPYKWW